MAKIYDDVVFYLGTMGKHDHRESIEELKYQHWLLLEALKDILNVIASDELVPESVSYMKQARAAIARAEAS